MLFLLFRAGQHQYAIDVSHAVEVLPMVEWRPLAGAPAGVAGVFNYHGIAVPLIDLASLMTQQTARSWMSTRIIVVNRGTGYGDRTRLLGLLAEQATETIRRNDEDFQQSAAGGGSAPYLGRIAVQPEGMIQRIEVESLLPDGVDGQLISGEVRGKHSATR